MNIAFTVDASGAITDLNTIKTNSNANVQSTIQRLVIELTNKVKANKLSGSVLKVRTGRLRNSVHYKTEKFGNLVVGTVDTNVKYAGVHEYGFNGSVAVKAHMRTIKEAFGKPITSRSITIGAFSRRMNMPERSFMRTALAEMKDKVYSDIEQAMDRSIV